MTALIQKIKTFLSCEEALTTTEYAVMLAFIAVFTIAALTQFGTHISGIYSAIAATVPSA